MPNYATLCAFIVVVIVLAHSYHVDWCSYHPQCAHTEDICKDSQGSSMTRFLNEFILADPDKCSRCFAMQLARGCAYVCSLIPLRGKVLGLLS
jgi:hypothetical protein